METRNHVLIKQDKSNSLLYEISELEMSPVGDLICYLYIKVALVKVFILFLSRGILKKIKKKNFYCSVTSNKLLRENFIIRL